MTSVLVTPAAVSPTLFIEAFLDLEVDEMSDLLGASTAMSAVVRSTPTNPYRSA